jgi:hypothetical protein
MLVLFIFLIQLFPFDDVLPVKYHFLLWIHLLKDLKEEIFLIYIHRRDDAWDDEDVEDSSYWANPFEELFEVDKRFLGRLWSVVNTKGE